jgi:hypothetical protein
MTKLTEELESLLGDYWELAYEEGRLRISNGDKANEVLHKIRCAIEAELQPFALNSSPSKPRSTA